MDVPRVICLLAALGFLVALMLGFWLERLVVRKYPAFDESCDLERRSPTGGPVVEIESRR